MIKEQGRNWIGILLFVSVVATVVTHLITSPNSRFFLFGSLPKKKRDEEEIIKQDQDNFNQLKQFSQTETVLDDESVESVKLSDSSTINNNDFLSKECKEEMIFLQKNDDTISKNLYDICSNQGSNNITTNQEIVKINHKEEINDDLSVELEKELSKECKEEVHILQKNDDTILKTYEEENSDLHVDQEEDHLNHEREISEPQVESDKEQVEANQDELRNIEQEEGKEKKEDLKSIEDFSHGMDSKSLENESGNQYISEVSFDRPEDLNVLEMDNNFNENSDNVNYEDLMTKLHSEIDSKKKDDNYEIESSQTESKCVPIILTNGTTYLVREGKSPGQVFISVVVKAGKIYEDSEQKGVASFVSYLATSSNHHCLTSIVREKISHLIKSRNMEIKSSAKTFRYYTVFRFCLKSKIPNDLMISLDKLFSGICEWLFSLLVLPVSFLEEEFNNFLSLQEGLDISETFHVGKIINYLKKWYRPNRMGACVIGDLNDVHKATEIVSTKLASLFTRPEVQYDEKLFLESSKHRIKIKPMSRSNVKVSIRLLLFNDSNLLQTTIGNLFGILKANTFCMLMNQNFQYTCNDVNNGINKKMIKLKTDGVFEEWVLEGEMDYIDSLEDAVSSLWMDIKTISIKGFPQHLLNGTKNHLLSDMMVIQDIKKILNSSELIQQDFEEYFLNKQVGMFKSYNQVNDNLLNEIRSMDVSTMKQIAQYLMDNPKEWKMVVTTNASDDADASIHYAQLMSRITQPAPNQPKYKPQDHPQMNKKKKLNRKYLEPVAV